MKGTSFAVSSCVKDVTAVFHDRDRMEDAVRELVKEGVPPQVIRVSQGAVDQGQVRTARPQGSAKVMALGLAFGAIAGMALSIVLLLGMRDGYEIPIPFVVLRVIGGAAAGAITGALLASVFYAFTRAASREEDAALGDFVVNVKTRDEQAAADVRSFFAARGAELVPA